MPTPLRRASLATTVGVLVAAGLGAGAVPAAAAPVFHTTSWTVIVGDVTGDGLRDRVVLGYLGSGTSCAARVTVGKATGGGSGATATVLLPVKGDRDGGIWCPDVGVVLRGPTPADTRLAVGFYRGPGPGMENNFMQVFSLTSGVGIYRTGFAAQYQPGTLGTQDFDGDGWGDVWETTTTQEGFDGFDAYLVRDTTVGLLYAGEPTVVAVAQFVDLDHSPGVDIVVNTDAAYFYNAGVVAVDGRTGATQVLASSHDGTILNYKVTTDNVNHDGYPDLRVESIPEPGNGVAPVVTRFVNRTMVGGFVFQPMP